MTTATSTGLPWSVTVNTTDLTAGEVRVDYAFNEACPIDKVETSFAALTLTPEEPSGIG